MAWGNAAAYSQILARSSVGSAGKQWKDSPRLPVSKELDDACWGGSCDPDRNAEAMVEGS